MIYTVDENKIIVSDTNQFNAQHILECGQVFRYNKTDNGYEVFSQNHKAVIQDVAGKTVINCDDLNYFINYFDLNTNYDKIKINLICDKITEKAVKFGYGIRILKQDPLETIIGFIISANNNIPRIRKTLELLCKSYGTKMEDYYAFPTLKQLNEIPLSFFRTIGCGYRDKYLFETIKAINNGFDINVVYSMNSYEANKYLQKLLGIGVKVADCILLFAYGKTDVFPADTWIKKLYCDYNNLKNTDTKDIKTQIVKEYFENYFGKYSGYAQQYLYYYKRDNGNF